MTILIRFKNVYGTQKAYPANQAARNLAAMVGTTTLTAATLAAAERLGHTVLIATDEPLTTI